jgi:hypothetical protein
VRIPRVRALIRGATTSAAPNCWSHGSWRYRSAGPARVLNSTCARLRSPVGLTISRTLPIPPSWGPAGWSVARQPRGRTFPSAVSRARRAPRSSLTSTMKVTIPLRCNASYWSSFYVRNGLTNGSRQVEGAFQHQEPRTSAGLRPPDLLIGTRAGAVRPIHVAPRPDDDAPNARADDHACQASRKGGPWRSGSSTPATCTSTAPSSG